MVRGNCRIYDLYPGYACNARCLFCFNPASAGHAFEKEIPFESLSTELYSMYESGHRFLNVLGGEPTVRKDLPNICGLAKKIGYKAVSITTNGIRLSDGAYVQSLARSGLDLALVSIHGHTPELHDRIAGVPGALERALRGIDNMRRAGIAVQVAFVAHNLNHASLPDFFKFFISRTGVTRYTVLGLRYHGHMDLPDGRLEQLMVPMSKVAQSIREGFKVFFEKKMRPPRLCHFLPCVLPGYQSRMDNLVYPEDKSFDGFYLDPEVCASSSEWIDHKDKVKLPRCRRCVFFNACPGVEETYIKLFGDKEVRPVLKFPPMFSG